MDITDFIDLTEKVFRVTLNSGATDSSGPRSLNWGQKFYIFLPCINNKGTIPLKDVQLQLTWKRNLLLKVLT